LKISTQCKKVGYLPLKLIAMSMPVCQYREIRSYTIEEQTKEHTEHGK